MNKRTTLFILTFSAISLCNAQVASWVRSITGNGYDDSRDMICDSSGTCYVTGQLEYTASFNGYNLSTAGGHDIFVAKYDSAGNLKWAKRAGGSSGDVGYGVSYDFEGSVYIVGEFETTASFSGIQVTIQGAGNNMFVAKYDSSGVIQWVNPIGTNSGSTKGYAVACDVNGNVYALGTTSARAYFDGSSLFSSRGASDVIFIKFDRHGDFQWVKQIGGSDSDKGYGIMCHGASVYVTGAFEGSCKFSSSVTLNSTGAADFFIAKYDTLGTLDWAKRGGGNGEDIGWDVDVNTNGNIICTGEFQGTASFSSNSVSSSGNIDIFVVAYDDSGDNLWAVSAGGNLYDIGRNIGHDRKGNVLIGGSFSDDADFDTAQVSSNGDEDLFLACYDSSGNFLDVKSFGGPGNDRGRGVDADKYGNVYYSGEFWDHITFDSIYVQGDMLFDGYLVRFGNFPVCSANAVIVDNISCFNQCDGALTVSGAGEPPYSYKWLLAPQQFTDTVTGLCAGNYPVEVRDAFGCVSSDTIFLSQPSPLVIDSLAIGNTSCISCANGSIFIHANGGEKPYSYLWADGATTEDRNNLAAGTYSICITDANGCAYCDSFTVMLSTTSIAEIEENAKIKIFPNPAVDRVEVQFDVTLKPYDFQLYLLDLAGRRINQIQLEVSTTSIQFSELSPGIYFLEVVEKNTSRRVSISRLMIN